MERCECGLSVSSTPSSGTSTSNSAFTNCFATPTDKFSSLFYVLIEREFTSCWQPTSDHSKRVIQNIIKEPQLREGNKTQTCSLRQSHGGGMLVWMW